MSRSCAEHVAQREPIGQQFGATLREFSAGAGKRAVGVAREEDAGFLEQFADGGDALDGVRAGVGHCGGEFGVGVADLAAGKGVKAAEGTQRFGAVDDEHFGRRGSRAPTGRWRPR